MADYSSMGGLARVVDTLEDLYATWVQGLNLMTQIVKLWAAGRADPW